MQQAWHSSLENSPKCYMYKQFKSLLNVEAYLCNDIPITLKRAIARFRCSNFKIAMETGRYANIYRNFRFCNLCLKSGKHLIEDEFHVLFIQNVCDLYKDVRSTFCIMLTEKLMTNILMCTEI